MTIEKLLKECEAKMPGITHQVKADIQAYHDSFHSFIWPKTCLQSIAYTALKGYKLLAAKTLCQKGMSDWFGWADLYWTKKGAKKIHSHRFLAHTVLESDWEAPRIRIQGDWRKFSRLHFDPCGSQATELRWMDQEGRFGRQCTRIEVKGSRIEIQSDKKYKPRPDYAHYAGLTYAKHEIFPYEFW